MEVHHSLGCTCAHDTRERPARECDHVLSSTRRYDDRIALVVMDLFTDLDHNLLVLIKTDDRGIQHYLNACRISLIQKLLTYHISSDLCPVLLRAEKFMYLFKQLSSRFLIFIKYYS